MTIKDIAKLSGVSISTVSRVLNNRPDVSQVNRAKVLRVIEKNKYIPNNSARDLVRTTSDAIGVVARGISNPFYTNIIRAIESSIDAAGYTMVLQQIGSCDDEVKRGAMMERDKRLQGIVFLGGRSDYTGDELAMLNVPFVCCSYSNQYGTLSASDYSSVSIADEEEAFRAVKYLYEHGHRRIAALVSSTEDRAISQLRYQGYVRALQCCGIPLRDDLVISAGSFSTGDAYLAMQRQLRRNDDFTAVFSIADNMAIGAMRALREYGRRTPEDCSVIAIDGLEISAYIDPPLTTLCQPMEELGSRAVAMLVDMMQRRTGHRQETVATVLREGASVRSIS